MFQVDDVVLCIVEVPWSPLCRGEGWVPCDGGVRTPVGTPGIPSDTFASLENCEPGSRPVTVTRPVHSRAQWGRGELSNRDLTITTGKG